jgi:hypothetical protein
MLIRRLVHGAAGARNRLHVACLGLVATGLLVGGLLSPTAEAQVVRGRNLPIPVPVGEFFLNVITGESGTEPNAVPGWHIALGDFQAFDGPTIFFGDNGALPDGGRAFFSDPFFSQFFGGSIVRNIGRGAIIGPGRLWTGQNSGGPGLTNFISNSTANLVGFRFINQDATPPTLHYGWMRLQFSDELNAFPRFIVDYAFESSPGVPISAGDTGGRAGGVGGRVTAGGAAGGDGGGDGGTDGGTDGDDGGGGNNFGVAGVEIDPQGVLRVKATQEGLRGLRQNIGSRRASQTPKTAAANPAADRGSPLRKVSLTRLAQAVASQVDFGHAITPEMVGLAGLTRIQYAFYLPETQEIVVAGPAEPVGTDAEGRPVGQLTGTPLVRLEDLIVALRAFPATGPATSVIGCSIDPTAEGLQRMQQFAQQASAAYRSPAQAETIARGLKESLGLQTVSIRGVPADTRFAQVLVEADYRMKLIGIGLETPPIKLASWVSRAAGQDSGVNQLQRWYFVPNYDAVLVSPDQTAMQLSGPGVKLAGASELVGRDGSRRADTQRESRASRAFTEDFTRRYEELAAVSPVFAEMRNLFDLSVTAAFLRDSGWYQLAEWDLGIFGDSSRLDVNHRPVPTQVETAVNAIWSGSKLMTPLGGGVHLHPSKVLTETPRQEAEQLLTERTQASRGDTPPLRWWWD